MKSINHSIALLVVANVFTMGYAAADAYQFEIATTAARSGFSFSTQEETFNENATGQGADITYFFRPVEIVDGPLNEQVFLTKASFATVLFIRTKSDLLGNDRTGLSGRYVTDTDLIFDVDYTKIDDNSDLNIDYDNEYTVGVGKYLDDRTSAILSLTVPNDDEKIVAGSYKTIVDAATTGTYLGYNFRVSYINTDADSGYKVGASGTYFFFNDISIGAGVDVSKIGEDNSSDFTIDANYFFTPTVYGDIRYQNTQVGDTLDISFTALRIGAKF